MHQSQNRPVQYAVRNAGVGMLENQDFRPASVIGPLGEALTLDGLPPRDHNRWTIRRKAEVVAGVNILRRLTH